MTGTAGSADPGERVRALLTETARTLAAADARDEALAVLVPSRRVLGFERRSVMRPIGRVWRLGVLLLEADGTVRGTAGVTRAVPEGHPGHVAVSAEARRDVRGAANRGRFPAGETIDYDAAVIPLDTAALRTADGPLFLRGDRPLVRWSLSAGDDAARDLEPYLAERVDLLLHPPQGA